MSKTSYIEEQWLKMSGVILHGITDPKVMVACRVAFYSGAVSVVAIALQHGTTIDMDDLAASIEDEMTDFLIRLALEK